MKPYKNIKTVFVNNNVAGAEFTNYLNIPFPVDEIQMKGYTYKDLDGTNNNNLGSLTTNLVNGQVLTARGNTGVNVAISSIFKGPEQPIQGEYVFRWNKIDGSSVQAPGTFHINISICFVFIEY